MNDISNDLTFLRSLGTLLMDAPMSAWTTFKTGGPADYLLTPHSASQIPPVLRYCGERGIPLTVIGWGSNLLVSDRGIRGLVLRIAGGAGVRPEIKLIGGSEVYADSGALKSDLISFCADQGFAGAEFMAGIPGCIGGGVFMNAGTNIGDFSGILKKIRFCGPDGSESEIRAEESGAGYRSIPIPQGAVITGAEFSFMNRELPEKIREKVRAIVDDRNKKHPVTFPSAGSVFKNPPGHASWKLIQDAGLRGRRIGGAMISELHTNFIINAGGALSADILSLVREVQERVHSLFGVDLETEIKLTGEF